MKITIYTIPECQFSKTEKEYLSSKNIPFEEKNLEANRDFLTEMLTLSNNFAGTPVTKIEKDDGQIVILKGFTKEEFEKELGAAPAGQVQPTPEVQTATAPVTEASAALDQAAAAVVPPGAPVSTDPVVADPPMPPSPIAPEAPAPFAQAPVADMNMPAAPDMQQPAPTQMTPDMQANFPPPQAPAMPDMNSMNTQQPEMGVIPPADPNAGQMGAPDQSLNSILNNLEQKVSDTPDASNQPQQPQAAVNPDPMNPPVPPQA